MHNFLNYWQTSSILLQAHLYIHLTKQSHIFCTWSIKKNNLNENDQLIDVATGYLTKCDYTWFILFLLFWKMSLKHGVILVKLHCLLEVLWQFCFHYADWFADSNWWPFWLKLHPMWSHVCYCNGVKQLYFTF